MITIIHGDNQAGSRETRHSFVVAAKNKGLEISYLDGQVVTRATLETALTTSNLFSSELLVVDNLLSRLRSHEKSACLTLLTTLQTTKDIVLWDHKAVTPATLKLLPSAKVIESKIPKTVFSLADSLAPRQSSHCLSLFHQVIKDSEPQLVFGLLVRRLGDLIVAKSCPEKLPGAPWQKASLLSQAKLWELPALLTLHSQLLAIDEKIKTGTSKLDLSSHLDLLFLQL